MRISTRQVQHLKPALDHLYLTFDYQARVAHDPLEVVHHTRGEVSQQVMGLICALMAYGRVDLFKPLLWKLKSDLENYAGSVEVFARHFDVHRDGPVLAGFKYRMTHGGHLIRLFGGIRPLLDTWGDLDHSLGHFFSPGDPHVGPALTRFVEHLYGVEGQVDRGFRHLVSSPALGSACKRLNLWLRWMVRSQPGVDLGLFKSLPPSHLLLPLDTHSFRMAQNLGLTGRRVADWRSAEEITAVLRQLDPHDPVKYDFALCHLGMSGGCPPHIDVETCQRCELNSHCIHPRTLG